jgi:hypothetical protein
MNRAEEERELFALGFRLQASPIRHDTHNMILFLFYSIDCHNVIFIC